MASHLVGSLINCSEGYIPVAFSVAIHIENQSGSWLFIRLPWLGQCGRAAAGCARAAAALRC
jgi:hypothetical protein